LVKGGPNLTNYPLILGSGSPQRLTLIRSLGIEPRVIAPQTSEEIIPHLPPGAQVEQLAQKKLDWVEDHLRGDGSLEFPRWILTADTLVFIRSAVLEKPQDRTRARIYLDLLSGSTHEVATGVNIRHPSGNLSTFSVISEVTFRLLTEKDKEWYLDVGEWQNAAGGYRIQGAGSALISRISGSYTNIIGLPLAEIYGTLATP